MVERPMKAKNLKIIDHMGTYYATLDGTRMWKIEKWMFKLLMMCDGKKSTEDIVEHLRKVSGESKENIRIGLKPIFEDMKKHKMITIE